METHLNKFENWFTELCSDERWTEYTQMHNPGKNFKAAAKFVFGQLVSDPDLEHRPMKENRKHVYNKLVTMAFDKVAPSLQQVSANNAPTEDWKPVSPEERERRLSEWKELINNSNMVKTVPKLSYKEIAEQGDWLPPKGAPYPSTSENEFYVRQRHLLYIKKNYEPRTGKPLPDFLPEEEWIQLFEEGLIQID